MQKILAIRLDGTFDEKQPLEDTYYLTAYQDLGEALEKYNVDCRLVKDDRTYLGGNRFARSWRVRTGKQEIIDEPFDADLIFKKDRAFQPTGNFRMVNDPAFDELCNDKLRVHALFPALSPQSLRVDTQADVTDAFAQIPSAQIVLKPIDAYGGQGVFIGPKEEALQHLPAFPFVAQEFIDTSHGIPGITDTHHDFRMIVTNGDIIYSMVRTPREGSLVSNVAQGGVATRVPKDQRPQEAIDICYTVDAKLGNFKNRIYSVDCARDRSGQWKLIELNAPPGQENRQECGDEADIYFGKFCEFLVGCMR